MSTQRTRAIRTEKPASSHRRRPSRRVEILRRTAHLFLEHGFETTSMVDIAGATGISKPGLYYHFKSKQDLLAAIVNHAHDILEDEIAAIQASSRDDEEALRRILHAHALGITHEDDAAFSILAVEEVRSLLPADRTHIASRKRAYVDAIRVRLEGLAASGRLRDVDTTAAAYTLAGMVLWLTKWYRPKGRLTADQVADEITKLALHSVLRDDAQRTGSARRPAAAAETRG